MTAASWSRKKTCVVVGGVAVLVLSGGAAFAYWTAGGSGDGTGASGSNEPIGVNQTSIVSGLAPGLPAQPLSGNFTNPNASTVYVTSVSATVSGTDTVGCGPSDYKIAGTAAVNAEIPAGSGVGAWTGLTLQFNNKVGVDQNACKNAVVTIVYTST